MKKYLAFLALTLLPVIAAAEGEMAFFVQHEKDKNDRVIGDQLEFRLKEEIRKSSRLKLFQEEKDAVYGVYLTTLVRAHEADDPLEMIYAATLMVKEDPTKQWITLDQTVGIAGRDRLQDVASRLMVWIDTNIDGAVKIRLASLVLMQLHCNEEMAKKDGRPQ